MDDGVERVGADRRTFVTMVVHELRGPLTAALGMSEMLASGEGLDARMTEELRAGVYEAVERLVTMLDDVLLVGAGPDRGAARQAVDPGQALGAGLAGDPAAEAHAAALSGAPAVAGDPGAVARCLAELIRNGRAPSAGRVEPRLAWTADREWVTVNVVDDGPQILVDERGLALARLDRPPGSLRSGRNPGLGVQVAAVLAAAQGGAVSIDDEPGGGCVFRLTLPRAVA